MLASPDVLGFDLEMPSCLDFEETPGAYKTETKPRKVFQSRRSLKPCVLQSRTSKSDSIQAITMIPKTESNAVMPDDKFEIAERPAKKRKSKIARTSKPEASALPPPAPQISPEQESQEQTTEQEPDLSESEMDELAMSCCRPRGRAPIIGKVVPCRSFGKNLLPPKRASSRMADISDDELGF